MVIVSGWHDLPSDARAFSLKCKALRLNKGFIGCLIFSKVPPVSELEPLRGTYRGPVGHGIA